MALPWPSLLALLCLPRHICPHFSHHQNRLSPAYCTLSCLNTCPHPPTKIWRGFLASPAYLFMQHSCGHARPFPTCLDTIRLHPSWSPIPSLKQPCLYLPVMHPHLTLSASVHAHPGPQLALAQPALLPDLVGPPKLLHVSAEVTVATVLSAPACFTLTTHSS